MSHVTLYRSAARGFKAEKRIATHSTTRSGRELRVAPRRSSSRWCCFTGVRRRGDVRLPLGENCGNCGNPSLRTFPLFPLFPPWPSHPPAPPSSEQRVHLLFGLFLKIGFDTFHLSRVGKLLLPGGRPVFPDVPAKTPEQVLTEHGLKPDPVKVFDGAEDVTLVSWRR